MNTATAHAVESLGPIVRGIAREHFYEVKSKTYRRSPAGYEVGRFIDGLALARRPQTTRDSYEQPLAWFSTWFDDVPDLTVFCERGGDDRLASFLAANWGDSAEMTLAHRWKVLHIFFDWAKAKGLVPFNPMAAVPKPRRPRTKRERIAYEQTLVHQLIDSQDSLRDRCALGLLRLAIRKEDLRMLQLRDIDIARDVVRLNHAKGGERHRLPIVFPAVIADLKAHLAERTLASDGDPGAEYLLYAQKRRWSNGTTTGGPLEPMDRATVHRWFKGRLKDAGLPASVQMHELRHTALDHIWRTTGNLVLAQKLARHHSPATTAVYLHPTDDDLRAGLMQVVRSEDKPDA